MGTFTYHIIDLYILSAAGVFTVIQLIYYLALYNRIHRNHVKTRKEEIHFSQELPPLSVIIYAHDDSKNLSKYLPSILEQDYPLFEVIVINEALNDDIESVLVNLAEKYPNLYHTFTPDSALNISHKKLALSIGIKASKYNWLVFTETNCQPVSNQWLRLLARNFTSHTQIVLGYSSYESIKGWKNTKISFDDLFSSIRYLGFALADLPYKGIGKNMAYRKDLFTSSKGYTEHLSLRRGEDDLFINKVARKGNTRVETSADAVIRIYDTTQYENWKSEKLNYDFTSRFYRGIQRNLSGFETCTRLFFYAACTIGIILSIQNMNFILAGIYILLWLIRLTIQMYVINKTTKDLGEKKRYYFSLPIFDFLQPIRSLKLRIHLLFTKKAEFMRR